MEHPRIQGLSDWRPLARGRLAVIWQARQLSLDRLVAVKVYHRELDEGDRRRFLREAAAGSLSDHPGIVTTHAAGVLPDDRPYLIMELRSGRSLAEWLKPENRPSEEQVRQIGIRIADALAAAHACGVLHRNVNPANILIDSFGNPGLADFGQAAVAGAEETADGPPRTAPEYAPPETFLRQPATRSGDVYSLGATLYALLAGSPARRVDAASLSLEQMAEVAYRPVDRLPGVNSSFMDVLITALNNDPAARPTAAKFRDLLANVPELGSSHPGPDLRAANETSPHRPAVTAATVDVQPASDQAPPAEAEQSPRKRRLGVLGLAAALIAVIAFGTAWLINKPAPSSTPVAASQNAVPAEPSSSVGPSQASTPRSQTSSATPGAGEEPGSGPTAEGAIEVANPPTSAEPFQIVPIHGMYRGGAETVVRVQRWEQGNWLDFPVPTTTDQSGRFTAHVELEQPGRHRLRVVDAETGVRSEPFVLVIRR